MSIPNDGRPQSQPVVNGTALHSEQLPAAPTADVIKEVVAFNGESNAHEDQWSRAWLAAEHVRSAETAARRAGTSWANADFHHKAVQAENPERTAPRPRQWLFAAGALSLDGKRLARHCAAS